jgi:hypothetical protein
VILASLALICKSAHFWLPEPPDTAAAAGDSHTAERMDCHRASCYREIRISAWDTREHIKLGRNSKSTRGCVRVKTGSDQGG